MCVPTPCGRAWLLSLGAMPNRRIGSSDCSLGHRLGTRAIPEQSRGSLRGGSGSILQLPGADLGQWSVTRAPASSSSRECRLWASSSVASSEQRWRGTPRCSSVTSRIQGPCTPAGQITQPLLTPQGRGLCFRSLACGSGGHGVIGSSLQQRDAVSGKTAEAMRPSVWGQRFPPPTRLGRTSLEVCVSDKDPLCSK